MSLFLAIFLIGVAFVSGVLLGKLRNKKNYDGFLDVSQEDASQIHQLEIVTPPDQLANKKEIRFRVRKVESNGVSVEGLAEELNDPTIPAEWRGV